jgi:hypothetical protein
VDLVALLALCFFIAAIGSVATLLERLGDSVIGRKLISGEDGAKTKRNSILHPDAVYVVLVATAGA